MKDNKSASLFQKEQVIESLKQSFVKLNPRMMIKNPIMFTVEVATAVMFFVTLYSIVNASQGSFGYNIAVFVILFVTLLFANFAEAIAEARGKAQADSLRKTREETPAKKVEGNKIITVSSSQLKKGDVFVCEAGDVIPSDGEIIEGLASIDESAITGESAPVIREAGGDKSSVTGGTKVLSDRIKVMVTTQPYSGYAYGYPIHVPTPLLTFLPEFHRTGKTTDSFLQNGANQRPVPCGSEWPYDYRS